MKYQNTSENKKDTKRMYMIIVKEIHQNFAWRPKIKILKKSKWSTGLPEKLNKISPQNRP